MKFCYCTEIIYTSKFHPFQMKRCAQFGHCRWWVGVSSSPLVAGVLPSTSYGTSNSKQISSLVVVPIHCQPRIEPQTRADYGSKRVPYMLTHAYQVNFEESPTISTLTTKSECKQNKINWINLTLSSPIFLPIAYSPALIYCGRERGWWITCWLKSVLHEEKCRTGPYSGAGEQTQKKKCWTSHDIGAERENRNVGQGPT